MKCDITNKIYCIIALIFIVLLGVCIQYPYMNEFPSFIHAWSQTDRYALALGFYNNDLDLFHPETFIYNKQYPHWWKFAHNDTITSVDFPFLEYIVAILMKITGITSPWVFRTCTLIIALIGMFFLHKLTFLITKDRIKSLLVTAVAMTSPVYAYYFNGFIPGVPALTFAIISMYFYVRFIGDKKIKSFILTISFITLSVLIRSSFAVLYVAILCFEFLRILRKETTFKDKIIPVLLSVVVLTAYYLWNKHLAAEHGTLFLSDLMPAKNHEDFMRCLTKTMDNWKYHYFNKCHYQLFNLVFVLVMIYLSYKLYRRIRENNNDNTRNELSLWFFVAISLFGDILFVIAMMKQFPNHDYYFIDTFFLPLLLLLTMLLKTLPNVANYKQGIVVFLVSAAFVFMMIKDVNNMQKQRRKIWRGKDSERTISNYKDSEHFLDSIGVAKDAKILTPYAYPQNTPFILMNRKGYTAMFETDGRMKESLSFDYDYVIIEDNVYKKLTEEKKEMFSSLRYVDGNGKISVYVKNDE